MGIITNLTDLEAIYGEANPNSLRKVVTEITPLYHSWITASRFCVVSTVGAEGVDGSPRGEDGSVVKITNPKTLLLPDWHGNNRLDTLRNIVADGRISLMFMVAGSATVVRVNGQAVVRDDAALVEGLKNMGKHPATVIETTVTEAYFQCAKAIMRSELWTSDHKVDLPSAGDFIKERIAQFDATAYDDEYPERAKKQMW